MTLAAAIFTFPPEPYYPSIYRTTVMANAARKAYACLRYFIYRWGVKDGRIIGLTNKEAADWCTEEFGNDPFGRGKGERSYGSTKRRCFQYGLQVLKEMGIIRVEYRRGVRTITILTALPGAKGPPKPRKPRVKATPAAPPPCAAAPIACPDIPELDPEDAGLTPREIVARHKARIALADAARPGPETREKPGPSVIIKPIVIKGFDPNDPKLAEIQAELEAKKSHPAKE
jgi:hypothetical protein